MVACGKHGLRPAPLLPLQRVRLFLELVNQHEGQKEHEQRLDLRSYFQVADCGVIGDDLNRADDLIGGVRIDGFTRKVGAARDFFYRLARFRDAVPDFKKLGLVGNPKLLGILADGLKIELKIGFFRLLG